LTQENQKKFPIQVGNLQEQWDRRGDGTEVQVSRGKAGGQLCLKMDETEIHFGNLSRVFVDFLFLAKEIAISNNLSFSPKNNSSFEWFLKYLPTHVSSGSRSAPARPAERAGVSLKILILTWNVGGANPSSSQMAEELAAIFSAQSEPIEFVMICLQESCPLTPQNVILNDAEFGKSWASFFRNFECLEDFHGNPPESLVGLTSFFFARKTVSPRISNVSVCFMKTGFAGFAGNKGCVGLRFILDLRISVACLNVHFSSGDSMDEARKAELKKCSTQAFFPGNFGFMENDVCFVAGDFNSRLMADGEDELERRMKNEEFEFDEEKIQFKQTYKLVPGREGVFVENRNPGWCDRILFRATEGAICVCEKYNSLPKVVHSDHSPVYAVFNIKPIQNEETCGIRRLAE
jgi:hypothetical protein